MKKILAILVLAGACVPALSGCSSFERGWTEGQCYRNNPTNFDNCLRSKGVTVSSVPSVPAYAQPRPILTHRHRRPLRRSQHCRRHPWFKRSGFRASARETTNEEGPTRGAAALALAGCAQTEWVGPPGAPQQAARCRLYARHGNSSGFYASGRPSFVAAATLANALGDAVGQAQDFDDCMQAAGYTEVVVQPQPASPPPSHVPAGPVPIDQALNLCTGQGGAAHEACMAELGWGLPPPPRPSLASYPEYRGSQGNWAIERQPNVNICAMGVTSPGAGALVISARDGGARLNLAFAGTELPGEAEGVVISDGRKRLLSKTFTEATAVDGQHKILVASVTKQEVAGLFGHNQLHVDAGRPRVFLVDTVGTQAAYQTFASVCQPWLGTNGA